MKHLATIQSEFLKYSTSIRLASDWDELSYDAQRQYLQQHPESKRRITNRPGASGMSLSDLRQKLQNRLQILVPGRGWQSAYA